jgi:hypothetical protein
MKAAAIGRLYSRRTHSARLPDLEDLPRAEKGNIERLEEVGLSEQKRNLVRIGPGQREAHRRQLPDCRNDHDTASTHMRQSSTKSDVRLLGVSVEAKLNAQGIGQNTDGRAAINQSHSRQRPGLMAKDDRKVRHQVQPTGSRVPVAVGKLLDKIQELVPSSTRAWASWAAASGAYSGV